MPSATFSLSETDSRRGSGQSMLDDSDFEDVGSANDVTGSASKHYWLGKLVFTQLLGEAVFSDAGEHDSGDSLDVRCWNGM